MDTLNQAAGRGQAAALGQQAGGAWRLATQRLQAHAHDFAPAALELAHQAPSPLPRALSYVLLALIAVALVWAAFGRLDIIAVAPGKLAPATSLKVVQPADGGIIEQILVREGDRVQAGQVLVRMDASLTEADSRQVQNELQVRDLQLRRIEAELAGVPLRRLSADPPDLYAQSLAQYQAHRQAYLDQLAAEQAVLARAEQELNAALEQKAKLEQTLPIYQDQERSWRQLVDEGFAGRLMAEERKRQRIEAEQELKAQTHAIEAARATITQSAKRIAQIESTYRQQLADEKVEAAAQYARLTQDWRKQSRRQELLELKAPQDGIIKEQATHTVGAVLGPGSVLMTLVPTDEALRAEVWVDNADIGFVREGHPVKLKVAPYPFQKYGMIDGRVEQVSADASEEPGQNERTNGNGEGAGLPRYRAIVSLDRQTLEADGAVHRLAPGMQAQAEIKLGSRTVLEYLLSPVQKAFHEAGRER
jgi:HlyD family secretion protein